MWRTSAWDPGEPLLGRVDNTDFDKPVEWLSVRQLHVHLLTLISSPRLKPVLCQWKAGADFPLTPPPTIPSIPRKCVAQDHRITGPLWTKCHAGQGIAMRKEKGIKVAFSSLLHLHSPQITGSNSLSSNVSITYACKLKLQNLAQDAKNWGGLLLLLLTLLLAACKLLQHCSLLHHSRTWGDLSHSVLLSLLLQQPQGRKGGMRGIYSMESCHVISLFYLMEQEGTKRNHLHAPKEIKAHVL